MKVKRVVRLEKREDVYDLEVKRVHNFAVNDGIIVHNCIDAVRYSCNNLIGTRKVGYISKSKIGAY